MPTTRRTVLTMGLISTVLAACGRGGLDADRLNEVVRAVDGVEGSNLTIEKPGGGSRSLRGGVQLPDDEAAAKQAFDAALRALSDEIGGDADVNLMIYVHGEYAGGQLSTADVGAPLNPSAFGLWQHYNG